MTNLTAFGWGLSHEALDILRRATDGAARAWWEEVEPVLMELTGADRKMDEHVVYKNFPAEVLAMGEAEYWLRQILMYWGLPNALFTEAPLDRPLLDEKVTLAILHPAKPDALREILRSLLDRPARWTDEQRDDAAFLLERFREPVDFGTVAFKENMARLAVAAIDLGLPAKVSAATDVLRIVQGMSDEKDNPCDVSLREPGKVRKLRRRERRFLAGLLEECENVEADFARRPELWKRVVHQIHPGDWKDRFPRVVAAAKKLYEDSLPDTDAAIFERLLAARDPKLLRELAARPGEMTRRLHHLLLVYGMPAAEAFVGVLPRLRLIQLLTIERYLAKVNERKTRTFPPRADWSKLQIVDADPERRLGSSVQKYLAGELGRAIGARVARAVPAVSLSPEAKLVKLPTNDSDLAPYGRGTVFPIPQHVKFIRSATYWATGFTRHNVWFDNGWNFFDRRWKEIGACCWSAVRFPGEQDRAAGAIFSGDPTNTKDLEGRACQLIDLYLDELARQEVRYAVWNVLCYSRVSFDEAKDVLAALQWGTEPAKGKLFEPARCQLSFPIKGPQMTKYVAFVDLARRQLVYIDANLRSSTSSAAANGPRLERTMPAFCEYLDMLPSVFDAFAHAPRSPSGMPVVYSDEGAAITGDREAYVFRPSNEASRFRPFSLNELLVTA